MPIRAACLPSRSKNARSAVSSRAIFGVAFGNAGCKYDDSGAVPLNAAERHNVSAIKKVEAKEGC
jgi:hypothetical protein